MSGLSLFRLDKGDTSTGYPITNVGFINFPSTVSSNKSSNSLPESLARSASVKLVFCSNTRFANVSFLKFDRSKLSSPQVIFNDPQIFE